MKLSGVDIENRTENRHKVSGLDGSLRVVVTPPESFCAGGPSTCNPQKTPMPTWPRPLTAALLLGAASAHAESKQTDYSQLSLEDLLQVKVAVASSTGEESSLREAPGIVVVITRDEILRSGARDLIDVLRMVTGFNFGNDTQGTVGVTTRGIYAFEGKVLFLWNKMPINDLSYGTAVIGDRFPLDQIQRIEIIRGPGSAAFGGFAELGVVNIVTRPASELDGVSVSYSHGQLGKTRGFSDLSIAGGAERAGVSVTASGYMGDGIRSDRDFIQADASRVSLKDLSSTRPLFFELGVGYKDVKAQVHFEQYREDTPIPGFADRALPLAFNGLMAQLNQESHFRDNTVTISSGLSWLHQNTWQSLGNFATDNGWYWDKPTDRITLGGRVAWAVKPWLTVMGGAETYLDIGVIPDSRPLSYADVVHYLNKDGQDVSHVQYLTVAALTEAVLRTEYINVTLGGRVEHNSAVGASAVPRLALTKVLGDFHAKVLLSGAYRAPVIENISVNPRIKPERTWDAEVEVGYQIAKPLSVTADAFYSRVSSPITFGFDPAHPLVDIYYNGDKEGTRGVEGEVRWQDSHLQLKANYSFYQSLGYDGDLYAVTGHSTLHLAIPAHKGTLSASIALPQGFTLTPSVVAESARYTYARQEGDIDDYTLTRLGPDAQVNLYLRWLSPQVCGLELGAGVYDLFNSGYTFASAYSSNQNPLPGPGRELLFRVGYQQSGGR
jgi:outer membrane receptor protein involved in Fe transport